MHPSDPSRTAELVALLTAAGLADSAARVEREGAAMEPIVAASRSLRDLDLEQAHPFAFGRWGERG